VVSRKQALASRRTFEQDIAEVVLKLHTIQISIRVDLELPEHSGSFCTGGSRSRPCLCCWGSVNDILLPVRTKKEGSSGDCRVCLIAMHRFAGLKRYPNNIRDCNPRYRFRMPESCFHSSPTSCDQLEQSRIYQEHFTGLFRRYPGLDEWRELVKPYQAMRPQ
jgi:hypothetical protein